VDKANVSKPEIRYGNSILDSLIYIMLFTFFSFSKLKLLFTGIIEVDDVRLYEFCSGRVKISTVEFGTLVTFPGGIGTAKNGFDISGIMNDPMPNPP
jgi:hypothetical protein